MPKDYKNINKEARKAVQKPSALFSAVLSFVTGLSIGLLVAAYFYLELNLEKQLSGIEQTSAVEQDAISEEPAGETQAVADNRAPIPKFEFYDILKNRKLNISEEIASEQENTGTQVNEANIYLLQVGSFKEYQAADQLRAQLALLGIPAYITRVVINGDDSRHRVRVGPFESPQALNQTRNRLEDNNLSYMLLKLELGDE